MISWYKDSMVFLLRYSFLIRKFFYTFIKKLFSYIVIYTEVFLCFYQETISLYFYLSEVFLYFYQETIPLYCYLYRSFSMLLYFSLNFNIYGIHSSHQVISWYRGSVNQIFPVPQRLQQSFQPEYLRSNQAYRSNDIQWT